RPGMAPICTPSIESGRANENDFPCFTHAAPRRVASASIRLMVPISSSGPHRPQLRTFRARAWNVSGSATRPPFGPASERGYPAGQLAVVHVRHHRLERLERVRAGDELVELELAPQVQV